MENKETLKIKINQTEVRNEFHFNVQRKTRMSIFRDRTKYSRKTKHKGQTEIDVNEWFTDEDNESLFAVVTVADRSIVSTAVDGGKVTFTGRKVGLTQVTLTAADAKGESAVQAFTLVVRDASAPMDVYPNPATDYVNVRPGASELDAEVIIYNAAGSEASHVSATLGINSPLKVDVKSLAPGRYTVEIRTDGKVYGTSTFVKK